MHTPVGSLKTRSMASLIAAIFAVAATPVFAANPLEAVLEDFETGSIANAVAATPTNSPSTGATNSSLENVSEGGSLRLKISDADGSYNGAVITLPGAVTGPGYFLITADLKVDNTSAAKIGTFGMGAVLGAPSSSRISDTSSGYVMNLTGEGDGAKGYQTIGAAVNAPAGGVYPQDLTLYFSTDVSSNSFNASAFDGNFNGTHRGGAATWPAGSSNAVYVDNIKRIGPGNFGEDRHLWISIGDGYTDLIKLENLLVKAKQNNFTAVDILARYRADAYYVPNRTDATYPNPEPFGQKAGPQFASVTNDPLQYAIDRGHELGLKVYISFGCFLVSPNNTYPSTLPTDSIQWAYNDGSPRPMNNSDMWAEGVWADPGLKSVRDYTKNVLMDVVSNYDIDGVIFDRIRYPNYVYSYNPASLAELGVTGMPSPTNTAFREVRQDVIADFMADCYNAVTTKKPWVVVGATPIATGDFLTETYNFVFQSWPEWNSRTVQNRTISFGCVDLLQPQLYRTTATDPPYTGPAANTILMNKTIFGDISSDALDFGIMPGAMMNCAPLFYHPNSGDASQSAGNATNARETKSMGLNGFGLFAATTTLADAALIRASGTDVLAPPAVASDYLFKKGFDKIAPNAATDFTVEPQPRGSVVLTWETPAAASDGDTAGGYYIYKSATTPVREVYANQVNKLPLSGEETWHHAAVGVAGTYYYKIVPVDDYNNRGPATQVGPITVAGSIAQPADIIIDNPQAAVVGSWTLATSTTDKFGINFLNTSKVTPGTRTVTFAAPMPLAGTWDAYEWHNQGGNRASDARHTVTHAAGSATVVVNQKANGGKWNKLGSYQMNAGQTGSVKIDNNFTVGDVVVADAIRFSYVVAATVAPAAPTNLVAIVQGKSQIDLSWTDNAGNETGYEIERWIKGAANSHVIVDLPAGSTSYSDTSLGGDTEYCYLVRAYNTGAQSADSNTVVARTLPDVPDVIVDDPAATFVGVWGSGAAATDFGPGYRTASRNGGRTATFTANITRTAVYDVYEWHVAGTNRAPDAKHLVHSAAGIETVVVNQTLNGGKWNKIATATLNAGPNKVVLNDLFSVGTLMADAIKWVYVAEPVQTPNAPSGLAATVISDTEIALAWADNSDNETGFEVSRSKAGAPAEVVSAPGQNTMSYNDTGLDSDTNYTYTVRAVRGVVKSGDSNAVTAKTLRGLPADVIVDNPQAAITGLWTLQATAADRWATDYVFCGKGLGRTATFRLSARDTGLYQVFEWHPAGSNRAQDARHTIRHRNGSTAVRINQSINGGKWNSLGTYAFEGGANAEVIIDDNFAVGTVIMADAVKLVWVGELPPAPAAPAALSASTDGSNAALSWTDGALDETAYEVLRNGALHASLPANSTSFLDTGLTDCIGYTYAVRAANLGGNSGESNSVTVSVDVTDPTISAPADVAVGTSADLCGAIGVALGSATASDNCATPVVTNDAPAEFPVGETTVIWTATDAKGNTATATQKVTVADDQDPSISAPAAVSVGTDAGSCSATNVDLGSPTTGDNCGVQGTSNDAPAVFPKGETLVTWTVTDVHGNTAAATQVVTVNDREEPQITCPADIEIGSSIDLLVPVEYEASATDNCGEATVEFSPASGSGFPIGTTEVTVTATDEAGNTSTCTFNVTRAALGFSGFSSPVGGSVETGNGGSYADPVRNFKLNSTIPLKFALTSEGEAVTAGVHTLQVIKYSSETDSSPAIDATPTDAATTGNQFRLTSDGWHFNLKTKTLSTGTWLVVATMSDGSKGTVWIGIK